MQMRKIGMTIEMTLSGDGGECPSDAEMRMALAQVRAAVELRLRRQDFVSLETVVTDISVSAVEIPHSLAKAA
jgi:hypothetical protein